MVRGKIGADLGSAALAKDLPVVKSGFFASALIDHVGQRLGDQPVGYVRFNHITLVTSKTWLLC